MGDRLVTAICAYFHVYKADEKLLLPNNYSLVLGSDDDFVENYTSQNPRHTSLIYALDAFWFNTFTSFHQAYIAFDEYSQPRSKIYGFIGHCRLRANLYDENEDVAEEESEIEQAGSGALHYE